MGIEDLTELQILEGSFSLIWVIIATISGLKIVYKSIKLDRKDHITVGLSLILVTSPWWSSSIQFILYIMWDITLSTFTYLLIMNFMIPIALLTWIYSFSNITYPNYKKILMCIYFPICILMEVLLIYFLLTNIEMIGTVEGLFNSRHSLFGLVFQLFAIISVMVTGVIFSLRTMKVDIKAIQWRGRFMLIAFLSFTIGALFDSAIPMSSITIVLIRLLLISSAIEYYLGFFFPDRLANWLIKP